MKKAIVIDADDIKKMLVRDNTIWSDTGDTEVTYRADTKQYILKKIAEALNA